MKNIVIYWDEFRGKKDDLISFVGSKRDVYLDLFNEIAKDSNLYLCFGSENVHPGLRFGNCYRYSGGTFDSEPKIIRADAVLDRSRGHVFPENETHSDVKVLNCHKFKRLAGDKWEFYQSFGRYAPLTRQAKTPTELKEILDEFSATERVVVKPQEGLKGEGITIDYTKNIDVQAIRSFPVLVQEFSETKGGLIDGSRSDLRVVMIDGEPIYAAVRTPQEGSLLANVAQGGTIKQVSLAVLPQRVLEIVKDLGQEIKRKYNNPFYSIDFGVTKNGPVIFELNNFIGFPRINKKDQDRFVKSLARVLIERTVDES